MADSKLLGVFPQPLLASSLVGGVRDENENTNGQGRLRNRAGGFGHDWWRHKGFPFYPKEWAQA